MGQRNDGTLILGGGFAGLFAAIHLRQQQDDIPITLIDREDRFIFKPLLYDFLSSEVQLDMAWPSYDELLLSRDITFVKGDIQAIDLEAQQVRLANQLAYGYQYLVLALGGVTGYFGIPGARDYSLPFRSAGDAFALGQHLRDCLQQASQSPSAQPSLLTVAIIGAGPSGVELAATLADLLPEWYDALEGCPDDIRIVIVQRGDEILKGLDSEQLRETAREALGDRRITVDLLLGASVEAVEPTRIRYQKENKTHQLDTHTAVWTAGNTVHPLIKALPVTERDRAGRLSVTPELRLPEFPNVFAGGDCSVNAADPQPATAQVAYQQGAAIADNISALIEGGNLSAAEVTLRGTLLKLGMEVGAAEVFDKFEIKGHLGHIVRHATYLGLLPTPVRNIKVGAQWLTDEIFEQALNV
ncbi:MAG: NAD(P)/FAD-dependent oxidoreductase [Cyanobacteria bacterium P01_A01_bin.114]